MRDKNLNYIQFKEQVSKYLRRELILPELLRTAVTDSPTFPEDLIICYPRKYKELLGLAIVHWYLPDNLKWRIHLDLSERSFSQFNSKQKIEINLMLKNKEIMLKFLYETKRYTSYEIFGNILRTGAKELRGLKYYSKKTVIKRPQRKRGYSDKGSLRPREKWLPSFDFTLTALQNEKEKTSIRIYKSIDRITKFLENSLTEE